MRVKINDLTDKVLKRYVEAKTGAPLVVVGCRDRMSDAVGLAEAAIEESGLSCRVITKNRSAGLLVGLVKLPWGIAVAAAMLAHVITTYNPHYIVVKNYARHIVRIEPTDRRMEGDD